MPHFKWFDYKIEVKKLVSLILTAILMVSFLSFPAGAADIAEKKEVIPEALIYQHMAEIRTMPECGWTDDTEIKTVTPLYDLDDHINGYIFELSTEGKDTGFIELFKPEGEFELKSFAVEGGHSIHAMEKQNVTAKKMAPLENKIYYLGGYDYLRAEKDDAKKLYDLNRGAYVEQSKAELKAYYSEFKTAVKKAKAQQKLEMQAQAQKETPAIMRAANGYQTIYVTGADYKYLVIETDFPGRSNHCAPIAGTSLIKYWGQRRGITGLYYGNDTWVFNSLRSHMQHSDTN